MNGRSVEVSSTTRIKGYGGGLLDGESTEGREIGRYKGRDVSGAVATVVIL